MENAETLLARFLRGAIDPDGFRHRDHIGVGFAMLRRYPFLESARLYSSGLQALARRAGRPQAYNATITLAYLSLIAERMRVRGAADLETFAAANADLFDKSCLTRWYAPQRLSSDLARETFVLPDPGAAR